MQFKSTSRQNNTTDKDIFKRILSRQPNNLLSVKVHKINFEAFKHVNVGKNKKKTDIPHEQSVQNNLAMQATSQTQILHKLQMEPGCLT